MKIKVLFAAGLLAGLSSSAFAQEGARVGMLECNVAPGVGMVITSEKALDCSFSSANGARVERYVGTIRKFGVALGATGAGKLAWWVTSASNQVGAGALAGEYAGLGGSATVGVGAGANVMVGGNGKGVSLQPLSAQVQTGLDVSAGVSALSLQYVGPRKGKRKHRRH